MIKHFAITLMGIAVLIGVISISLVRADTAATIDFEGLDEGAIVTELSCGSGITCSSGELGGSVLVRAHNPTIDNGNTNTAMIFNAECVAFVDCSGGDNDLSYPGHGKTLINSEDLDQSDPDDQESVGSFMEFDFSGLGPDGIAVHSIDVGDIEEREIGAFVAGSDVPCTGVESESPDVPLPITGNNVIETVDFELSGVQCLLVHLNGSGTVDNISFTTVDLSEPGIDIEKSTNGEDADDPTGPMVPVGSPVDFTYEVANTGNVDLTNVTVEDDQGVAVSCPQDTLAAGESMTCTGSTTAAAGQYTNLGTACGDGAGQNVCDEDRSNHFGTSPAIDIEKSTNGEDADDPTGPMVPVGSTVDFTYEVANTGNVDLTNVTVEDDQGVAVSCPQDTLAAGESMTCTGSTTATPGQYTNLGTACGDGAGQNVCDEDRSNHFGASPDIDIEKSTNGEDADDPTGPMVPVGSTVDFTYEVANTGNVDLTNVTVRDDQVSVPATGSAPGTIDFEGLEEGAIVTELGCGSGITCSSGDLGGSVLVRGHNPAIDSGNTNTAMIFNAECVALVDCTGGDDDLSYPGHGKTLINSADLDSTDPDDQENLGSFMEFDFSGFGPEGVTVHSIDVGDIEEREIGAFVAGTDGSCSGVESGSAETPLPITGNNVIETVNFELSGVHCFLVHLNGSGTVDNIQFTTTTQTVPVEVEVTCPQDTLAVGESMTCTGSTTATPGQYTNLGTACGDGAGQNVCDEDRSNHFGASPDIDIEKSTNGEDADDPTGPMVPVGSTVDFTYEVANTGNVDLTNVTVRDDQVSVPATGSAPGTIDFEGLEEGAIVTELGCGSGITCSSGDLGGSVLVRGHNPAIDSGNTNTAMIFNAECVALVDCTGGDDDLSYPGHGKTLINSADLDSTDPDDQENLGSFMEFDFSGFGPEGVTVHSIDVGDIEEREIGAFVAGTDGSCSGVESGSAETPLPITGNNVIETVNFELSGVHCFLVHLNGSGTVDNIQFTTTTQTVPVEVEVTCPQDALAVGESMTCTGSTTATPGQYTNLGTACGDGAGQNVCDEDPSNHFGEVPDSPDRNPEIDLEKWTRIAAAPAEGNLCDTFKKPVQLTMLYTGDNILDHTQDSGKVNVDGDPGFASPVNIISAEQADGTGKVYFDGNVDLGDSFVIDATGSGKDKLKSRTFVLIQDQNGELLQTIEFHTSCSQPLELGNQFGGIQLISLTDGHGESGTFGAGTDAGVDADSPAGPEGQVGDNLTWTYFVTNTGDTPLGEVTVVDDNGTPEDVSDDFSPTFISGDENADNQLDLDETWLYQATDTVKLGQYANIGEVSGVDSDGTRVADQDPSHYLGVSPSGDICQSKGKGQGQGKGKPNTLTMLYSGHNILDHSQKEGKVNVSGDPQGALVVHIISSDKSDGTGKTLFDGNVNLGEQFVIGGTERLKSRTFVLIMDQDGELLQTIEFHTSCSQPLERGDQFGGIQLIDGTSR